MRASLAIVGDTWRQSKQQIVFLLLLVVMLLLAVGAVALPRVLVVEGKGEVLALWFQEEAESGFEASWDRSYQEAIAEDLGYADRLAEPQRQARAAAVQLDRAHRRLAEVRLRAASAEQQRAAEQEFVRVQQQARAKQEALGKLQQKLAAEAQQLVEQRAPGMTPLAKGVEVWLSEWVGWLFMISMWGFIAAAAGYFPGLLRAGAVDVVVAKPLWRAQIFAGKYVGGLVLYGAALLATTVIVFLGLGVRTGVWHFHLFAAIPLTLYAVALLYSLVACVGVFTRSTALSIVLGYGFYFIVDTAIGALQRVGELNVPDQLAWIRTLSQWSRLLFPGFSRLESAAAAAVIHVPVFEWQPILVGCGWLVAGLAAGCWWFRRMDF